jgi:hypothetical protein
MPDFQIRTDAPRFPPPSVFWGDVWKITLGVCLGTLLAGLVGVLFYLLALSIGFGVGAAVAVKSAAAANEAVEAANVRRINEAIRDYEAIAAGDAGEQEKAEAADLVAEACRIARDAENLAVWQKNARTHQEAAAAGRKTRFKR